MRTKIHKGVIALFFGGILLISLSRIVFAESVIWVIDKGSNELIRISGNNDSERATLGGFDAAKSLAIDNKDGSAWVADTENNRVMQVSEDGKMKLYLIDDEIARPFHIAISSAHRVLWIANSLRQEVIKFSLDDKEELARIRGFNSPHDIVVSAYDDSVWVSDNKSGEIIRLSYEGKILTRTKCKDFKPDHLAINPNDGTCWVTTSNNLIAKFSSDGKKVLNKVSGFDLPYMIIINPDDDTLWVSDGKKGVLTKFSSAGAVLKRMDNFNRCFGLSEISRKEKTFWLADTGSGEIIKLNTDGQILARLGGFKQPFMLATEE